MVEGATFGARLKALRLAQGLTLRRLAERVGLDPSTLSRLENDRRSDPPAEATIRRLAAELGADPEVLILLADRLPADFEADLLARPEDQVVELYRSMRGRRYTTEEWAEITRLLREKGRQV